MPDELPGSLPIDPLLGSISSALGESGRVVVEAPTGAGKTTRVPLALLDAPWRPADQRIVVLEPRRVAARTAARRMAATLGERTGGTVGYATRHDRAVSAATRIEVVTEGILVRRLQRDPSLTGTSTVIFDEFHERSLDADVGLALASEARDALRPDLRIAVMSATLEGQRVARLLGGAPVVTSSGRSYPVEVRWSPRARRTAPVEPDVVEAVLGVLASTGDGDVLVFLPGGREIRRVARGLAEAGVGERSGVIVAPLHGALPTDEQDRAIDPVPDGTRKVVLATDIAETSLTIPGVRVVVDAGLSREPRFDPATGMSRLVTVPVSRAGAEQRAGRAGRVAPGVCVRLWSEAEHTALEPFRRPEIVQADLAGFALDVARWGASHPTELRLLDPPPPRPHARAVELLTTLGALDADGRITAHGRQLADLPLHPRLAHMVLRAAELDLTATACAIAALLGERDVLTTGARPLADLTPRLELLDRRVDLPAGVTVRRGTLDRVRRERARLLRAVGHRGDEPTEPERIGLTLAFAYPDRVAQRRPGARGSFLLSNGRGATLPELDPMAGEEHLVVADVDAGGTEARIHLAAAVTVGDLELALTDRLEDEQVVAWDAQVGEVVAERRCRLGSVVLRRAPLAAPEPTAVVTALLDAVRDEGLGALPWTPAARDLRARLAFLRRTFGEPWPDVSDEALLEDLACWLGPFLTGMRRRSHLRRLDLTAVLRSRLRHDQHAAIEELAPSHLEVPSGSRIRLDYASRDVPVLPVRVQEMFGGTTTPTIAGGRVRVLLRLLSPAHRPVQVTDDLAGFWLRTYPQVRSELRGRYPKHAWPEDPLRAPPVRGVRRR